MSTNYNCTNQQIVKLGMRLSVSKIIQSHIEFQISYSTIRDCTSWTNSNPLQFFFKQKKLIQISLFVGFNHLPIEYARGLQN